jgi:hypothetical protein
MLGSVTRPLKSYTYVFVSDTVSLFETYLGSTAAGYRGRSDNFCFDSPLECRLAALSPFPIIITLYSGTYLDWSPNFLLEIDLLLAPSHKVDGLWQT